MKDYIKELISFAMLVIGLATKWLGLDIPNWIQFAWYFIAVLPVGLPVVKEMIEEMKEGEIFSEFFLMVAAAVAAFVIGEYPEGLAVLLFYSVGERMQDAAVDKAQDDITALIDVCPEEATVLRNGKEEVVESKEVKAGETIIVKAGGRVPIDGTLLSHAASFDTAAITGESAPRMIDEGGQVLSGMIASDSEVRIITTKVFSDSTMSRIINMVKDANERKSKTELFIKKFARIYTMVVVLLAVLVIIVPYFMNVFGITESYDWKTWLSRAAVFMVVSCPCALLVSIPLGYFGGIGAASRNGILVKGGNFLDVLYKVKAVAFDKTGTLTRGEFDIKDIQPAKGTSTDELISVLASIETHSTHPMAKAICKYAKQNDIYELEVNELKEVAGRGLKAELDGKAIYAGNIKLLTEAGIEVPEEIKQQEGSIILCGMGNAYVGAVTLTDAPKAEAAEAVKKLNEQGIEDVQVLSGDRQSCVSELAETIGIKQAFGDLLPEGKVKHIEELKAKEPVAFVGDGINDAPVLALADVGIAMGAMGSDVAIETADVVIEDDNPAKVATAIIIAQRTRQVVWQNVTFAMGFKILIMVLGLFGIANMWIGVLADSGVAILAVLNAVRIQRAKIEN